MKSVVKDMPAEKEKNDAETLRALKHDIKNQLSNIYLAVEQLRYEISDANTDCQFYIDLIATSATSINSLLDQNQ
jgi:nitrogen-specific signal transduction histidine kinase